MKKIGRKLMLIVGLLFITTSTITLSSCGEDEIFCSWYVYDADGILTGYRDKVTCQQWAATWNDVTCTCK